LEPSPFSDNGSLQNLLMLTAAKADKSRLMDYISRLNEFNTEEIANMCIQQGLFEEALEIYKKTNDHQSAANVLVDHIVSIDRAQEYAEGVDEPAVWSKVAKAQLDGLRVTDAIESYIKAQDPSNFNEVIETATHAGKDEDLIKFLRMARKTLREPAVDTAMAFSFARLDQLPELEDFLRSANVADVEASGDKAYEEGYHQAAKIFFTSISNWAKLATTLVHLEEYQNAVDCARRANNVKVWKQVHEACVQKKEFRLAQICGLNLMQVLSRTRRRLHCKAGAQEQVLTFTPVSMPKSWRIWSNNMSTKAISRSSYHYLKQASVLNVATWACLPSSASLCRSTIRIVSWNT
jgi:clathrin heavy chain